MRSRGSPRPAIYRRYPRSLEHYPNHTETTEGKFTLHERWIKRFAEVCKIDRAHMAEIERGDINVTVRTALKVAKGLRITLAGLFEKLEHAP